MKKYLEISHVTKEFPTPEGPLVIVRDFDVTLAQGEFVSVIGHSGCGKSTVLSMVAGLTPVSNGAIILSGREVQGPGPDRGVVFQAPCLLPWLTAEGNVLLGVNQVMTRSTPALRQQTARSYLELVGLADSLEKHPAELSLGMRQRVGLARAFALLPKLLLLDEPFGMLDSLTRFELQEVLIELWRKDRKTALMVTHDVDEALYLSDRIVMMTSGPEATVGEILHVPFPRPRHRVPVMEHPDYDVLRERMLAFLGKEASETTPTRSEPGEAAA